MKRLLLFLTAATLIALFSCTPRKPAYPLAAVSGGKVRISLALINGGEPYFMSLVHGPKRIDFFALMVGGVAQSYFDACVKCYPKKMGYRKDAGDLLCRACDVRYPLDGLKGIGGCYPIPLEGRLEADDYVIDADKIIAGERYF